MTWPDKSTDELDSDELEHEDEDEVENCFGLHFLSTAMYRLDIVPW